MSYILDALRKAEAERERGNVPSVHAQPMFPSSASQTRTGRQPPAWMVPAGAAVLLLGAAGVWWGVTRSGGGIAPEPTPVRAPVGVATVPAVTAQVSIPAPVTAPAMALAPAAPPPTPTLPPSATATPPSVTPGSQPLTAPPPAQQMAAAPAPPPTRSLESIVAALPKPPPAQSLPSPSARQNPALTQGTPAQSASTATSPPPAALSTSATAPQAGPSESRVYALNELPDEVRRQLPTLAVGGSMYSPTPANRLLIVNGQVLHEGDRVTPELTLLQIKVKVAVLEYRGYRYAVNY